MKSQKNLKNRPNKKKDYRGFLKDLIVGHEEFNLELHKEYLDFFCEQDECDRYDNHVHGKNMDRLFYHNHDFPLYNGLRHEKQIFIKMYPEFKFDCNRVFFDVTLPQKHFFGDYLEESNYNNYSGDGVCGLCTYMDLGNRYVPMSECYNNHPVEYSMCMACSERKNIVLMQDCTKKYDCAYNYELVSMNNCLYCSKYIPTYYSNNDGQFMVYSCCDEFIADVVPTKQETILYDDDSYFSDCLPYDDELYDDNSYFSDYLPYDNDFMDVFNDMFLPYYRKLSYQHLLNKIHNFKQFFVENYYSFDIFHIILSLWLDLLTMKYIDNCGEIVLFVYELK